jgi:hypothetical protein
MSATYATKDQDSMTLGKQTTSIQVTLIAHWLPLTDLVMLDEAISQSKIRLKTKIQPGFGPIRSGFG